MDAFFVFVAKYLFLVPVALFGTFFLLQRRPIQKWILLLALPSLLFAYLLAQLGGYLYYDPRPFVMGHFTPLLPHVPDNGFPSDHALLVSAVAAIAIFCNRRLALVLWVFALLVAVARVYVGLHHVADVAGSFAFSLLSAISVYALVTYIERTRRSRRREHAQNAHL